MIPPPRLTRSQLQQRTQQSMTPGTMAGAMRSPRPYRARRIHEFVAPEPDPNTFYMPDWEYTTDCDGNPLDWIFWDNFASYISYGYDEVSGPGYDYRYVEVIEHTNGQIYTFIWRMAWSDWVTPDPIDVAASGTTYLWSSNSKGGSSYARVEGTSENYGDAAMFACIRDQAADGLESPVVGMANGSPPGGGQQACGASTSAFANGTGFSRVGLGARSVWDTQLPNAGNWRAAHAQAGSHAFGFTHTGVQHDVGAWPFPAQLATLIAANGHTDIWDAKEWEDGQDFDTETMKLQISTSPVSVGFTTYFVTHELKVCGTSPAHVDGVDDPMEWSGFNPGYDVVYDTLTVSGAANHDVIIDGADLLLHRATKDVPNGILYAHPVALIALESEVVEDSTLITYVGENGNGRSGLVGINHALLEWWVQFPPMRYSYIFCP